MSLNVPLYYQKENWWCGPASVEMVLQYIQGWSYS
ncbi:hypothetical protein GX865_04400 [Candidatus Saccharibacteria bacterium]|nr:hypothetical protein [Candidatus Saccharibacteria bacterium]NLK57958.1 hypothetical protein [Tissierellia bacterium]